MAARETGLQHWLKERKFYNIKSKSLDLIPEVPPSPKPGSSPIPDDQGQQPVCTSHAVGKCVVDILDGFGYDCDQEEVVTSLKERVQPLSQAVQFEAFEGETISVKIWKKETDGSRSRSVSISLKVQRQSRVNIANWTGPIQGKQLKEHHLSVAGIWDCKPKALKPEDRYHAVYIKEIIKNPGIKASQKKLYFPT